LKCGWGRAEKYGWNQKYGGRRALKYFVHATFLILLAASVASAQGPAPPDAPAPKSESRVKSMASFLAGGAAGLVVHESGHVVLSGAFGAHPRVRPLEGSAIPFFKIVHDPVSRRREFVISSAGFWMQHASSEWILTKNPGLRRQHAPFQKGVLAFNLGASAMYSVVALSRHGAAERDTRGIAASLGRNGVGEPIVGLMVLAPAVLDGYRYLNPNAKWAVWTSRAAKIASVALVMAAGR